jgi:hypothetical protein
MKLFEITGISRDDAINAAMQSRKTDSDFKQLVDELSDLGDHRVKMGSGLFSVVTADPERDPGTVRKVAYGEYGKGYTIEKLARDAYYNYILEIAKGSMKWNPYLPKVYAIHFHRAKDGLIAFEVELERLEPFTKLNRRELIAIGSRIYGDPTFEQGIETYMRRQGMSEISRSKMQSFLLRSIVAQAQGLKDYYGLRNKDSRLRHALMLLNRVKKTHSSIFLDMHDENVMVRRTPVGVQLVLTDPIAS